MLISDIIQSEITKNIRKSCDGNFLKEVISDNKIQLMQSQKRHLLRQYEKLLEKNKYESLQDTKKQLMYKYVSSQFTTSLTNKYSKAMFKKNSHYVKPSANKSFHSYEEYAKSNSFLQSSKKKEKSIQSNRYDINDYSSVNK